MPAANAARSGRVDIDGRLVRPEESLGQEFEEEADFCASDDDSIDEADKLRGLSVACGRVSDSDAEQQEVPKERVLTRSPLPPSPPAKISKKGERRSVERRSVERLHGGKSSADRNHSDRTDRRPRRSPSRREHQLRTSDRRAPHGLHLSGPPPLPQIVASGPAMMPMLHAVMIGEAKLVTARGAILQLSDGGPVRYMDGLLKNRGNARDVRTRDRFYVKVVRLEPGLVVVDSRTVDQKTGEDSDPYNEQAEVEDWIDVPSNLVGHIIGKNGARIRTICEKSGADLRFDELPTQSSSAPPPGMISGEVAADGVAAGAPTKRLVGGSGGGDDLRRFLEAAKASSSAQGGGENVLIKDEPHAEADDLKRFLAEARGDDDAADDGADDLRRFLAEARGSQEVDFTAEDHAGWEALMMKNMKDAGIGEVYIENLIVTDKKGKTIDIAQGLRPKHFPIHVRYVAPASKQTTKKEECVEKNLESGEEGDLRETSKAVPNEDDRKLRLNMNSEDFNSTGLPRAEALHVTGVERLTRKDIDEILEAKDLPTLKAVEHIRKDEIVCVFKTPEDASKALQGLRAGLEDVEVEEGEGPGLWRARRSLLKYRQATTADIKIKTAVKNDAELAKSGDEVAGEVTMRLRVNGDAIDVAKARMAVLTILEELLGRRAPATSTKDGMLVKPKPLGPKLLPGEVRELVQIPSNRVGRVIGKGGETIKKLQVDSGARLRVAPAGDLRDGDSQEIAIQGARAAVEKARDLLEPIVGSVVVFESEKQDRSPSSPRKRCKASPARSNETEPEPAAKRQRRESPPATKTGDAARLEKVRALADKLERDTPKTAEKADAGVGDRDESSSESSVSSRTRRKDMRAKKLEMERKEIELYLKQQRQLDEAAAAAEAEAAELAAVATQQPADILGKAFDPTSDWVDETEDCHYMDMPTMTPYGAGRVSRAVVAQDTRYLTVKLLAGGTVQALESIVLEWVELVRQWLGVCVLRPSAALQPSSAAASKSASWVQQWEAMKARLIASGCGLVVTETLEMENKFLYNLVPVDSSMAPSRAERILNATPRAISASELSSWPRVESVVYLVDLCSTPKSLGHVVLCRHDYRTARGPYSKGDMIVMEGARRNARDVGVVRKVLSGVKAERAAATSVTKAAGATGISADVASLRLKRVLRKCTTEERARREGPLASLEASALPLLSGRLPQGAEALGVSVSLDSGHMRLFVRLPSKGSANSVALTASAATAAAALGAMLGCEAELLTTEGPADTSQAKAEQGDNEKHVENSGSAVVAEPEANSQRNAVAMKLDDVPCRTAAGDPDSTNSKKEQQKENKEKKKKKKDGKLEKEGKEGKKEKKVTRTKTVDKQATKRKRRDDKSSKDSSS